MHHPVPCGDHINLAQMCHQKRQKPINQRIGIAGGGSVGAKALFRVRRAQRQMRRASDAFDGTMGPAHRSVGVMH